MSPAGNVINTQCGPTHHTCTLGGQDPQVRDIRQHLLKLNRQVGQVSRYPHQGRLAPTPHPLTVVTRYTAVLTGWGLTMVCTVMQLVCLVSEYTNIKSKESDAKTAILSHSI